MSTIDLLSYGRKHGITPSQMHVLLILLDEGEALPFDIAVRAATTSSNVTGILRRLRNDGWVKISKVNGTMDQRIRPHVPTPKAFEVFGKLEVTP